MDKKIQAVANDVPIYELMDEKKTDSQREPDYSQLNIATINKEGLYATSSTAVHHAEKISATDKVRPQKEGSDSKITVCIFITIVVVAIVLFICFAVLFAEVAKLKQTATPQQIIQTPNDSSILLQLQQAILEIRDVSQNNSIDFQTTLNVSILQQVSAMLDENTDQLNRMFEMRFMELSQNISLLHNKTTDIITGQFENLPVASCTALPHSSPSDYYWVRASNGSAVRVYCDMTLSCGTITGGWTRVAELDMRNDNEECPGGLTEVTDSTTNIRTCRITRNTGCSSTTFSNAGLQYSHICGKIIAFQKGSPDAFDTSRTINENYLDGVSLTHGNPKQHIWSFAAAPNETDSYPPAKCPCILNGRGTSRPPQFVENNYFCDTGAPPTSSADPLWDGAGCGPMNTCCSFNNPPWFYRQLPQLTTDAIEMRVCRDEDRNNEDIQIQTIDIYIQ